MKPGQIRYFLCGVDFANRWRPHIQKGNGLLGSLAGLREAEDAADAHLLIASEGVESLRNFHSIVRPNHFRLQLCLEAVFPDLNFFDWAISFVPDTLQGRNFRPHPHLIFAEAAGLGNAPFRYAKPGTTKRFFEREFCDFIYSNPRAHSFRDNFFRALNARVPVSSLGRHLNSGIVDFAMGPDFRHDWIGRNISAKEDHRFSISIENSAFEGYTSEKLLTSFAAGSVPLYWGNRLVHHDYNPRRFVNLNNFNSIDIAAEFVASLFDDEEEWERITSQPVFTVEQSKRLRSNRLELGYFFQAIIEAVLSGQPRRGTGYWPSKYATEIGEAFPPPRRRSRSFVKARLVKRIRQNLIGDRLLTQISEILFRWSACRKPRG